LVVLAALASTLLAQVAMAAMAASVVLELVV